MKDHHRNWVQASFHDGFADEHLHGPAYVSPPGTYDLVLSGTVGESLGSGPQTLLGLHPYSFTYCLCDFGQLTYSVSSSVKRDDNSTYLIHLLGELNNPFKVLGAIPGT